MESNELPCLEEPTYKRRNELGGEERQGGIVKQSKVTPIKKIEVVESHDRLYLEEIQGIKEVNLI